MVDAGDNNDTSQDQTQQPAATNQGIDKVGQQLAEIAQMLANQNAQFEAMVKATAAPKKPVIEEDVDPVYDSKKYTQKILDQAEEIARRQVAREREMNSVVYQLSQDYPEISTDAALKKAILDNQRQLPDAIKDTAAGYETAILKAVHKAGLLPKSKRAAQLDEDVSVGSGRGSSSSSRSKDNKGGKLSEETLLFAELMGRDVNDPKVRKGLEEAAKRSRWDKWE